MRRAGCCCDRSSLRRVLVIRWEVGKRIESCVCPGSMSLRLTTPSKWIR